LTALARAATPVSPGFVAWVVRADIDAGGEGWQWCPGCAFAGKVRAPPSAGLKSLWPGREA